LKPARSTSFPRVEAGQKHKKKARFSMTTLNQRLSRLASTALVLPVLLAAMLGFSLGTSAATHTAVSTSYHHLIAADDPPPSH
jgi:hypothetical protein